MMTIRAAGRLWKRPTRNARTSFKIGDRSWRISTTDDGILNVSYHEPTDEGHDFFTMLVEFDLGLASITGGGRDCDGPISRTTEWQWSDTKGDWVEVGYEIEDTFAQAMNY